MNDYLRYTPMFIFGGFAIGQVITCNWKVASFLFLIAWLIAVVNRFYDVLKGL